LLEADKTWHGKVEARSLCCSGRLPVACVSTTTSQRRWKKSVGRINRPLCRID